MKAIFDSILLNRLQMEVNSGEIVLDCTVYEGREVYDSQFVLSDTAMNMLLNELSCRDIELDFDNSGDLVRMNDGSEIYHFDLQQASENPVFLPLYIMPERVRLLRA